MEYRGKKNIIKELECIWMSTNIVEEKLCNNNFDCDTCSFDREMRQINHLKELSDNIFRFTEKNILEETIFRLNKLKTLTYPPQYIFNSCFVLKKFLGDTYFLGFNSIVNIIFDNVTSTRIYKPSQFYKKGDKFINIQGDWGFVDISAPFNFRFESEVLPVILKPEGGKWIGFIKSANGNIDEKNSGKEALIKSVDGICAELKKYMKKYISVGITMYDGGERLKFIYQVIGKENYIKLLMKFLS